MILNKLKPRDLLAASGTCRYWRDVSSPFIADYLYMKIKSMDQAKSILSNTSVSYNQFFVVSFLLLKFKLIYIWSLNTNVARVN